MESILIVGSSLAKQVLENSERCGKNINSIIFKGKVDLNLVENALKGKTGRRKWHCPALAANIKIRKYSKTSCY